MRELLPGYCSLQELQDKGDHVNVGECIIEAFEGSRWIRDRTVDGGYSLRRPDVLLDLMSHVLMIEVYENRHNIHECICENKRIMQIFEDLEHRPVVFIWFNPDAYRDQNGLRVTSCWSHKKLAVMTIKPFKKDKWEARIDILKDEILDEIQH